MVPCDKFLEVYKVDTTFRLETPETIDPERTNPHAPFVAVVAERVGTSSPIVSRVLLQGRDVMDAAIFTTPVEKPAVIRGLHAVKESLLACQKAADHIAANVVAAEAQWAASPHQGTAVRRVIPSLPQVPDLDLNATQFLIAAKRAIGGICSLAPLFLSLDRSDNNFDHLGNRLEKLLGADAPLTQFVREYADISRYLIDLRNFQEHPEKAKVTVIENIRVKSDGSVAAPMWYVTGTTPSPIHLEMPAAIERLIEMAELTLIHLVDERLDTRWPFVVQVVADADIDVQMPIRYKLSVDISRIRMPKDKEGK